MKNVDKRITLITKKDCGSCQTLKHWLSEESIPFEEWKIEKKETLKKLLEDPNYNASFCDIESCAPHIPAIRFEDSGAYHFTGLNGIWDVYHLQKLIKEHEF